MQKERGNGYLLSGTRQQEGTKQSGQSLARQGYFWQPFEVGQGPEQLTASFQAGLVLGRCPAERWLSKGCVLKSWGSGTYLPLHMNLTARPQYGVQEGPIWVPPPKQMGVTSLLFHLPVTYELSAWTLSSPCLWVGSQMKSKYCFVG